MNECPVCKGSGKMTITLSEWGSDKPDEISEISCVHCGGSGNMSDEDLELHNEEVAMWCECGNENDRVDYYEDGEHPDLHKHHYRCRKCKGVVQIG